MPPVPSFRPNLSGSLLVPCLILFCIVLPAARSDAAAEGFFDLYGGAAMNRAADVSVFETRSSGTQSAAASIDLSSSGELGFRFGAWHPTRSWLGLGMDIGYFRADGPGVDISAFPLSLFLALRAPVFATPALPAGRLQPYFMAGLSFYIIDIDVRLNGLGGSSTTGGWPLFAASGHNVVGPYLAAGMAWQSGKNMALFGEYRYSKLDVGFDTTNSIILPTMNGHVETSVRTDHLLFGISYRFGEAITGPSPPPQEAAPPDR